jgi:hypothetical protein
MLAFLLHYRLLMHEFQLVFTLRKVPRKSTRLLGGMHSFFILCGKGCVCFILEDEVPHVLAVLPVELGDHVFGFLYRELAIGPTQQLQLEGFLMLLLALLQNVCLRLGGILR